MRIFLIFTVLCFLSCTDKHNEKACNVNFEISKNKINFKEVTTDLEFHKNVLKLSIFNGRTDTLYVASPYLVFTKKEIKQTETSDIIVKQFIPNIITDNVVAYYRKKGKKNLIISIDSTKSRDLQQYELKLEPQAYYIVEYFLNCNESDPGKYKIFFFESNRFNNIKYEKLKYPENGYLKIEK